MPDGWTLREAEGHLHPPIKRRELARLLDGMGVRPNGVAYGRLGRRARTYPVAAIMRAHAAWVKSQEGGR